MTESKISFSELVDWADGSLDDAMLAALELRLNADPTASELAARIRHAQVDIAALEHADSDLLRRVQRLARGQSVAERTMAWLASLEKAIASLVAGGASGQLTIGFRSRSSSALHGFESDLGRLDLQVSHERDEVVLRGQISAVPHGEMPGLACVLAGEPVIPVAVAHVDEYGYFELSCNERCGALVIEFDATGRALVVQDLNLSP